MGLSVREEPSVSAETLTLRASILRAEDRRLVDEELLAALEDSRPEIRALAVRALGRIGAASSRERLEASLRDTEPEVRGAAAYALGLLGNVTALPALHAATRDDDARVRALAADAIGLLGDPASADTLLALLADGDPVVVMTACFAVARYTRAEFAVDDLLRLVEDTRPGVRLPAIYTLARLAARPLGLAPQERLRARRVLLDLGRSKRSEVRALAARGLTGPISPEESEMLGRLTRDADPLVRIEAVGALGFPGGRILPHVGQGLQDDDDRVVLAAMRAISRMRGAEPLEALALLVVNDSRLWLRRQAIAAMGNVDPEGAAAMANGLSKSAEPELRQAAANLIHGRMDSASILIATRLFQDPDPRVRAAAIPGLAGADEHLSTLFGDLVSETDPATRLGIADAAERRLAAADRDPEDRADALALLLELYEGGDNPPQVGMAILDAAAAAGANSGARPILEAGLLSPHWQVRLRASRYFQELYEEDRTAEVGPAADRPIEDYEEILRWAESPRAAKVTVERPGFIPGQFTLRLDTSNAPLASRNFSRLAEAGFFDGLEIRRVVPGFVVQDGDPQGDGRGGPGYMIRDEITPSLFLAGTLGMASSGKDTAGSQWFITLAPQWHLNGRYTPFGQVVQNMPGVVSLLLPGDRVVGIEVYEGDGTEELPPPESL
jgi:cyclophilin family peptidyl-prolyl cis-trans isomerase/HEAT repeat protein